MHPQSPSCLRRGAGRATAIGLALALLAVLLPSLVGAPTAAAEEVPELWKTYAPRVYFDPQERYLPTSVEHIVEHATLHSGGNRYDDLTVDSPELAAAGSGDHLRIDSSAWGGMEPVAHPELNGHMLSEAPMYVTQQTKEHTIEITYWMFYAYNGCALAQVKSRGVWFAFWQKPVTEVFEWCPGGTHQGDIERIRVEVDRDTHAPISVTYRGHSEEKTYAWAEVHRTDTHPHVFPGLNTHANYAREGTHVTMSDSELGQFRLLYRGSKAVAGLLPPLGLAQLFGNTVMDAIMVDVNNASATIADRPNRGRVVWEPWRYGDGLVPVEPGTAVWDFEGRWGPEQTNTPLDKLGKKRNDSHKELNAMRPAFHIAMGVSGQKKAQGPDGPLQKLRSEGVELDPILEGSADLYGEIIVTADGAEVCTGEECEVLLVGVEEVEIVPRYDEETQFVAGWAGACEGTDGERCVIERAEVRGRTAASAVIDNIGLAVHGPGPSGTVTVTDADGEILCDDEAFCQVDGVVGDTFTVDARTNSYDNIEVRFVEWLEGCTGTSPICDVTIERPERIVVNAEVHMPMVVVERELDLDRSYFYDGNITPNWRDGATTLQLRHVRSSSDEAVFEMINDPMIIARADLDRPHYDLSGASLETMELVLDRDGLLDGEMRGVAEGHWERQWGYGHHNYTRTPGGWNVDGELDWETGDLDLYLDADWGLAEWQSAGFFFDALWPGSALASDGPGTLDLYRDGTLVEVIDGSGSAEIRSDEVVVTAEPADVPASGYALLATPQIGGEFVGFRGDYTGVDAVTLSIPSDGLDLSASFQFIDGAWGVVTTDSSFAGAPIDTSSGRMEVDSASARLATETLHVAVDRDGSEPGSIVLSELEFSLTDLNQIGGVDVSGTVSRPVGSDTEEVPVVGAEVSYVRGDFVIEVYTESGLAGTIGLTTAEQLGSRGIPLELRKEGRGTLELYEDGVLLAAVGDDVWRSQTSRGHDELLLLNDRAGVPEAGLALVAPMDCLCFFAGWSGDGVGGPSIALDQARRTAITASFSTAAHVDARVTSTFADLAGDLRSAGRPQFAADDGRLVLEGPFTTTVDGWFAWSGLTNHESTATVRVNSMELELADDGSVVAGSVSGTASETWGASFPIDRISGDVDFEAGQLALRLENGWFGTFGLQLDITTFEAA